MARTIIKSALAVALLLALAQLAYWLGVRRYFEGLAGAVATVVRFEHERIVAFPPGAFGLDGIRIALTDREDLVLRADRLRVRSPDAFWLLRWLLGWRSAALDHLEVSLEGVRASAALMRALKTYTGTAGFMLPFEGVGCGDSMVLGDADYEAMGWQAPRFDAELRFERQPDARRIDIALRIDRDPPGVLRGALRFVDVPENGLNWTADLGGARLSRLELDYDEQGTLLARNTHCADERAETNDVFGARHLERLHAWLGTHGVVPDEPVWAAYRSWLGSGGTLHLVAEPAPGVPLTDYAQFAPEDRLRLLGVSARIADGEPVPVEATAVRGVAGGFRALPPLSDIDPQQAFEPTVEAATDIGGVANTVDPPVSPEPEQTPATTPSVSSAAVIVFTRIGFPELALHLGQQVRISTVSGNQHNGIVLDATADALELEIRRYGGGARLPIARDQISTIDLITRQPRDGG